MHILMAALALISIFLFPINGSSQTPHIDLHSITDTRLTAPTFMTNSHDGTGRLFVLEQGGRILVEGREAQIRHPGDAIGLGLGYVPEDRTRSGLLLNFQLFSNHTLPSLGKFVRAGRIIRRLEVEAYQRYARSLQIRARDPFQRAAELSGGNQQKLVLSKWLERSPKVLILDEPTRGIDVGAKVEIYGIINSLARAGTAILMISSDLPEVLAMSDRVVVMHEGRITGQFDRREATKERVMEAAIS